MLQHEEKVQGVSSRRHPVVGNGVSQFSCDEGGQKQEMFDQRSCKCLITINIRSQVGCGGMKIDNPGRSLPS